ncbi:MAG: DUF1501 domain-containing protein [Verrucomicrobia bacterium]|nr:DUF1501 domain-containing protein [Verrucomicrobiota bacterium]
MNTFNPSLFSRRDALKSLWAGFGYTAFAGLAAQLAAKETAAKSGPLDPKPTHFPARAKHVIFLCMSGGPSHVDTFDYKPKLTADNGKAMNNGRGGNGKLLGSPWKFSQHGKSGLWISELFPEVAKHADDLCLIRSMHTDLPAHPQAFLQMHTGSFQFVRPSLGAWSLYGLGTENENLPGFITLNPPLNNGGSQNYGSAFLPAIYQGTRVGSDAGFGGGGRFGGGGDAKLPNISNSKISTEGQRAQIDFIQSLNHERLQRDQLNPAVEGVIESYELAFRMQSEAPKVMDLSKESEETKKMYGIRASGGAVGGRGGGAPGAGAAGPDSFGRSCLLARRMVEAGVRFVEIGSGGWDQHRNLEADHEARANSVDQPIAALLTDLKQRDLLKDTLVIWGGEFGRTPYAQGTDGRDHNNRGYTMWMAGGGVKGGLSYGSTDEYGAVAVENKVHIHDFHATILHLLGLNHEKLTYKYAGRDFRLTDVHGTVVKDIIA